MTMQINYMLIPGMELNRIKTPDELIEKLAKIGGYEKKEFIESKSRIRPLPDYRFICSHLLKKWFGMGIAEQGRVLKIHHATALYRIQQSENLYQSHHGYRVKFEETLIKLNVKN